MKTFKIIYPMDNQMFLNSVSNSFHEFLISGTSRSTAKLEPLHGAIATDIKKKLGDDYEIFLEDMKMTENLILKVDILIKKLILQ